MFVLQKIYVRLLNALFLIGRARRLSILCSCVVNSYGMQIRQDWSKTNKIQKTRIEPNETREDPISRISVKQRRIQSLSSLTKGGEGSERTSENSDTVNKRTGSERTEGDTKIVSTDQERIQVNESAGTTRE